MVVVVLGFEVFFVDEKTSPVLQGAPISLRSEAVIVIVSKCTVKFEVHPLLVL